MYAKTKGTESLLVLLVILLVLALVASIGLTMAETFLDETGVTRIGLVLDCTDDPGPPCPTSAPGQ